MLSSPTSTRLRAGTLALAAATALTLAGCSAGESSTPSAENAEITLALNNTPASFDPAIISQSPDSVIWSALYDRLLTISPDGEYEANAAESWEYSEGNTVLTLALRDDLSFADGAPITADAVVATLEYIRETPGQAQGATANFESVAAPDDSTVVITLSAPDPLLIDNLATSVGVIADPETLGDEQNATAPLESGPYELDESATVNGSVYVMKRRDDYWNADAYPFETLTVKAFADRQATINALSSGEVDASYIGADQVAPFQNDNYTMYRVDGLGTSGILFADRNGEIVPALADVRVRQAINMAFDREAIVEQIQAGAGAPAFQEVVEGVAGYDPALEGTYPYDPEAARELMAEAGYADGFDVVLPSTFLSTQIDATVVEQLGAIGIRATLEAVQPQDLGGLWQSKKYGMGYWVGGATNAARAFMPRMTSGGYFNPWNVTTPEGDALIAAAAQVETPEDAEKAWQAVSDYAVEEAISAPIAYAGSELVTTKGIAYLGTVVPVITTVELYAPAE